MSMLSSLSVWSAVKFPFLKFSQESRRAASSAECSDDFRQRNSEKIRGETAAEMVNLRIPWSQNVDKENSEPNLYCECIRERKKTKKKQVKFITVPEIPPNDSKHSSTENLPNFQITDFESCESEQMPYELEFKPEEEVDDEGEETSCIPSVKPWTVDELKEIQKKNEEGKKKMKKKNKRKENISKNHPTNLETSSKVLEDPKFATISNNCNDFFIYKQFYDCEKFCSKLGLNSGFTKKIHKIQ